MALAENWLGGNAPPDKPKQHRHTTGLLLAFGLIFSAGSPATADALAGAQVRSLALQGTWAAEKDWGYWSWAEDGTVCLRVFGPDGDCADTGKWSVDGNVLCYELTWWGESYDIRENCFTVHALDDGRYDAQYHGGALETTFIMFTVSGE